MTAGDGRPGDSVSVHQRDLFERVRQLNPDCDLASVERFFREIDEAALVLHRIDSGESSLLISFDPHWRQEDQRQ